MAQAQPAQAVARVGAAVGGHQPARGAQQRAAFVGAAARQALHEAFHPGQALARRQRQQVGQDGFTPW